jgi:pimeloyl-ACP methyl ester carboxylesterase
VVLVHGSGATGWEAWPMQRPLADEHQVVVVHRSGYPPNPPLEYIDFEVQALEVAELVQEGTHLVGQSYGGLVAMLAAARRPSLVASLTVIEPPAFRVARGNAHVEELVARLEPIFANSEEPRSFLTAFLAAVGSSYVPPNPLPDAVEASARAHMAERPPWDASIPLARLAGIRCLVVSGGHHPAFDAVCDILEQQLNAVRVVIRGAGHSVPRTGAPFNAALTAFIRNG